MSLHSRRNSLSTFPHNLRRSDHIRRNSNHENLPRPPSFNKSKIPQLQIDNDKRSYFGYGRAKNLPEPYTSAHCYEHYPESETTFCPVKTGYAGGGDYAMDLGYMGNQFASEYSTEPHSYPTDPHTYPTDPHTYPTDPHRYPTDPHTYPPEPHPTDDDFLQQKRFGSLLPRQPVYSSEPGKVFAGRNYISYPRTQANLFSKTKATDNQQFKIADYDNRDFLESSLCDRPSISEQSEDLMVYRTDDHVPDTETNTENKRSNDIQNSDSRKFNQRNNSIRDSKNSATNHPKSSSGEQRTLDCETHNDSIDSLFRRFAAEILESIDKRITEILKSFATDFEIKMISVLNSTLDDKIDTTVISNKVVNEIIPIVETSLKTFCRPQVNYPAPSPQNRAKTSSRPCQTPSNMKLTESFALSDNGTEWGLNSIPYGTPQTYTTACPNIASKPTPGFSCLTPHIEEATIQQNNSTPRPSSPRTKPSPLNTTTSS